MATVNKYSAGQVFVTFAGRTIEGRVEGNFVATKYAKPKAAPPQVGAGGDVTVSVSLDQTGEITLTLMQNSTGHALLTELAAVDRANADLAIAPFEIRDLSGRLVESAEQTWIAEEPETPYAAVAGERTWKLGCAKLVRGVLPAGG